MPPLLKLFSRLLIAGASLSLIAPAQAEWPSETVRLIVPYAPGGTTDVLSRKVADLLQQEIGTVVVENRPGAGSTMATAQLARGGRGADHTILMASPGHTIGPVLYKNLRYEPVKDFRFIRNIIEIPNVMTVPANSPYDSLGAFVEAAKTKELTFSSAGVGSSIHMSGELFKTMTGAKMTHVPFRGSGEALPALLSGDVDVSFENMPTVLAHIKSGKLRALAVTSKEPSPFLPGVGTVSQLGADQGLGEFVTTAWFGLIADDSMPDEAVTRLQTALEKVMADPGFLEFVAQVGGEPAAQAGDAFRDYVAEDVERWSAVAGQAQIEE
ncbi:Bug family tripartite tricarboxylate transporter substrate binding protein [Stutzerimonas azotifigens]|uniref:Tripartite tricarboxylate transporter substrate binding protein n=1 Tax=Stutzerimonas azotifigens TaxID=291995 RepID=A0ABR5YZB1_9GAMM|nr:tripartite tricarboxylate transporter substrate-binding protein [Stutzerimonas azotifigens]MBA1273277.1 tripartite tricarboxylate transporter substrate binding protein [Stutzerimonas azotifigens]